jgi:hypothetical protein
VHDTCPRNVAGVVRVFDKRRVSVDGVVRVFDRQACVSGRELDRSECTTPAPEM